MIELRRKEKEHIVSKDRKGGAIVRIDEEARAMLEQKLEELGDGWKISELVSLLIKEGLKDSHIRNDTK